MEICGAVVMVWRACLHRAIIVSFPCLSCGAYLQERQVRSNPSLALGITFLSALVLGGLIGAVLIVLIFRYRNRALRKRGMGPGSHPEYLDRALLRPRSYCRG